MSSVLSFVLSIADEQAQRKAEKYRRAVVAPSTSQTLYSALPTMKKATLFAAAWITMSGLALSYAGPRGNQQDDGNDDDQGLEISSHGTNPHFEVTGRALTAGGTSATSAITYHGGSVLPTPTAYVIWYGNWNRGNGTDTPAGQQIVRDFLNNVGGSPYFNINKGYYKTGPVYLTGNVTFGGETTDTGSQGTRLSDSRVTSIVQRALRNGALPTDANGVYFVLTSSDVSESSGFCTRYCGWHTHANMTGFGNIKFSFVGNAARCLNACAAQSISPNSNAGVDGMLSVIAHELEEAASDPDLNAWYDSAGAENADKCAWTFGGSQYQVANGSWANIHLGSRDYLIQRNLYHGTGGDYCAIALNADGSLTK